MENAIDEARRILEGIEGRLPFTVNSATGPEQEPVLATIRGRDGYPVLLPHVESSSMLTGDRAIFDLIEYGPGVIRRLLDIIEASGSAQKANKPEKPENTRNSS